MKYMSKFERKPKGKHNQADFNNSCNFHCPPPFSATKEHFLFSEMGSCILIHNSYSAQSWHCSFHAGSAKNSLHPHEKNHPNTTQFFCSKDSKQSKCLTHSTLGKKLTIQCKKNKPEMPSSPSVTKTQDPLMGSSADMDCIGSGLDVESVIPTIDDNSEEGEKLLSSSSSFEISNKQEFGGMVNVVLDTLLLISPFFFWGTAMVAMKEVLPKTGPLFVAAVRLIPSGFLLIGFAQYSGKKQPSGFMSWFSLALFGLVDAACFQGFLAEGLKRTSAGLGSVIIDSQPLTVAVLAAILFGESIGTVGAAGLLLGVIGLLLLEVPALNGTDISETVVSQSAVFQQNFTSFLGSGEWWMLLAAQSMAIGTVMVRWVCKYSDPVMATGWHMIIGGLPLLALSVIQHDPAFTGSIQELDLGDWLALTYTSIFGSAISYGVYFYNATRGSLTKLSSLTFLTPMFASIFGYFFLEETFSPIQLLGALITVVAIYMVNSRDKVQSESD